MTRILPSTLHGILSAVPTSFKNSIVVILINLDRRSTLINRWNTSIIRIIGYQKSIKIKTPYGHNTDIQSLRAGFCGGGGNIMELAEGGSYGRRYGRRWAHVTLTWLGSVYNSSRGCLSFLFLFSSFVSSLIDNPIVQACLHPSCCARASIDWVANILVFILASHIYTPGYLLEYLPSKASLLDLLFLSLGVSLLCFLP